MNKESYIEIEKWNLFNSMEFVRTGFTDYHDRKECDIHRISYRAESTTSSANFTSHHEGRSSPAPAVVNVRAPGLLADSIQSMSHHIALCVVVSRLSQTSWQGGLKPRWKPLPHVFPFFQGVYRTSASTTSGRICSGIDDWQPPLHQYKLIEERH